MYLSGILCYYYMQQDVPRLGSSQTTAGLQITKPPPPNAVLVAKTIYNLKRIIFVDVPLAVPLLHTHPCPHVRIPSFVPATLTTDAHISLHANTVLLVMI